MSTQRVGTRRAMAALRRRIGVLVAAAAVGLAAGTAYVLVEPPPLTSTAIVLLPTPAQADSTGSDVDTQVEIVLSATVLEQAGQAVSPGLTVRQIEKMIKVSAPTDQMVKIDATSADATQAQALAQAVSDSYVGYVSNTAREVTVVALADLKRRKDALQKQISQLQSEIDATRARQRKVGPNSAEGREEAQLLAGLRTQQADLSLQLDKVEDKIATGAPSSQVFGAGTSVIQQATPAVSWPTPLRLLVIAPLCALAAAGLAAIVLLLSIRRDSRMRFRDEIADAVGSPVLASVRSQPQDSVAGWSTLFASYEATPVESWTYRQLLQALVPSDHRVEARTGRIAHPASLTVISLGGDSRGLAVGPQLATFASSLGISTRVVPAVDEDGWGASLWAACLARRSSARPGLHLGMPPDDDPVELTIILSVVDRAKPSLAGNPPAEATVLAISAGTATEAEFARVAMAVDDTGQRITGIVVADPDPSDRTSGRHTMDERARQAVLPTRITGTVVTRHFVRNGQEGTSR